MAMVMRLRTHLWLLHHDIAMTNCTEGKWG
jgi:hypothetical protein